MNTVWKLKKTWQALTAVSLLAILVVSVAITDTPAHAASASVPTLDPTYGLLRPANVKQTYTKAPDWIWVSTVSDHQTVYLRKDLKLAAVPSHPVLYVTADNYFAELA